MSLPKAKKLNRVLVLAHPLLPIVILELLYTQHLAVIVGKLAETMHIHLLSFLELVRPLHMGLGLQDLLPLNSVVMAVVAFADPPTQQIHEPLKVTVAVQLSNIPPIQTLELPAEAEMSCEITSLKLRLLLCLPINLLLRVGISLAIPHDPIAHILVA